MRKPAQLVERARLSFRTMRGAASIIYRASPREFVLFVVFSVVSSAGTVVQLLLLRQLSSSIIGQTAFRSLLPDIAVFGLAAGLIACAVTCSSEVQRLLNEKVVKYYRDELCRVCLAVPLEAFEDAEFQNAVDRAGTGTQMYGVRVLASLVGLVSSSAGFVAALIATISLSPAFGAIAATGVLPLWVLAARNSRRFYAFSFGLTEGDRERNYLSTLLTGRAEAAEIRSFQIGDHFLALYHSLWRERLADVVALVRRRAALGVAAALGSAIASTGGLLTIAYLVSTTRMTPGTALATAIAFYIAVTRAQSVASNGGSLLECSFFIRDFFALLDTDTTRYHAPAPARDDATAESLPTLQELSLEAVTYRYPGADRNAVDGVTLKIRAGEVLAIVGENGSGKTTLAKVISTLLSPTDGAVMWDGVPLLDAGRVEQARDRIGVLFQDFVRYRLSLEENVRLGRVVASNGAAVDHAIEAAGLHQVVASLPDGKRTRLGRTFAGAVDLSGGEWQKVAIARLLFRRAELVILDEPTAALDARAEYELYRSLRRELAGRTVVLISHRLSSARAADRIVVLHAGHVEAVGTHEELMNAGGIYAELYAMQAAGYAEA